MENKIKYNYNLFSHFYAHIWIHISAFGGQGDLQDLSINFEIDVLLLLSASLIPISSFPLALSSSRNIETTIAYTKVIIISYEDGITLTLPWPSKFAPSTDRGLWLLQIYVI